MTKLEPSCRETSLGNGEPILGTAPPQTERWVVIESRAPFPAKVVKESPLADLLRPLTDRLATLCKRTRMQYIRRARGLATGDGKIHVFLADARAGHQRLLEGDFDTHEELLGIDIESFIQGEHVRGFTPRVSPLVLLCTHGKRDACCALHGRAFMKAAGEADELWETSHIGGHRFAATCVVLPWGQYYGRLRPEEAERFLANLRRGRMHDLSTYRGCATLSRRGQVAEGVVRERHALHGPDDLRLTSSEGLGEHQTRFVFEHTGAPTQSQVEVFEEQAPGEAATSCGGVSKGSTRCRVVASLSY